MFNQNSYEMLLTLPALCISESCIEIKIGLHKTFWGSTKKCEKKNLTQFFQNRHDIFELLKSRLK